MLAVVCVAAWLASCSTADEPVFRVVADHAVWTWFNDERALVIGDDLYVGYVDTAGYSSVAVLPLDGGEPVTTPLSSFAEVNDHVNPALLELPDGRVLAAYAMHHVEQAWRWRIATPTETGVVWSSERSTSDVGALVTYSNLVALDDEGGRIYNFFRGIGYSTTFMTSDDAGETWTLPRHLVLADDDASRRPYVKYASDGRGRIDLLYTPDHPRPLATDLLHVYYEAGTLHRSDGTPIQPLPGADGAPMPVDAGTVVSAAAVSGRGWVWDLEYDADGAPVGAFVTAADGTEGLDLRYHVARWDADAARWQSREIARAGTHLYGAEPHYAGGITLDPSDPDTVYVSADVDPESGTPTEHYQIYRGTTADGGDTWDWTTLTPDATEDHLRPFVPRGDRDVLLWLRGRYTTYNDYDMEVVALIG